MPSITRTFLGAAMLAMVHGQGVILKAVGDSGTSQGLLIQSGNTADANFISDAEITANVVNECGRTLLGGNMDIGENTENALAAGNVTKVKVGSKVKITIDQRNANGTGPFTCDMDMTGNAIATGQTPLAVTQDTSKSTTGQITLTATMPNNMTCQGSSAGNVCTVRCRNAQEFGGCVAVQQTDITPLAGDNPPSNITSAQTLAGIQAQIQENQKDLPAAIAGNQAATSVDQQGVKIAQAILDAQPAIAAAVQQELKTKAATAATATTGANTNANTGKKGGNGNANTAAKGNKNGGNANNAAAGATKGNGNNAAAAAAKGNNAGAGAGANGAATAATKGNTNAATGATKGNNNAAAAQGNTNAATGATKGNNNAAAAQGNNNAATGATKGNNNNNKRETPSQRRARYVQAGATFSEDTGN